MNYQVTTVRGKVAEFMHGEDACDFAKRYSKRKEAEGCSVWVSMIQTDYMPAGRFVAGKIVP